MLFVLAAAWPGARCAAETPAHELRNARISARFDGRGLREIHDFGLQQKFRFAHDGFSIELSGQTIRSEDLPDPRVEIQGSSIQFVFLGSADKIEVVYELRPGWRFISKQVFVTSIGALRSFHIGKITPIREEVSEPADSAYVPENRSWEKRAAGKDFGVFLRFAGGSGLFALVQNPFLNAVHDGGAFELNYSADMDWDSVDGAFESDRACIGTYALSKQMVAVNLVPEWALVKSAAHESQAHEDQAEIEAFENCVRAFVLPHQARTVKIEVGWTLNDYQIDIATPEGRTEYKRVIDRAAAMGADHLLFAPSNSKLALRKDDVDDWHWEHVLWLGLGQKIRRGEWDPARSPIPASVRAMLDYAQQRHIKLVAYVYPILPFVQNPAWLTGEKNNAANLGFRGFQDRLVRQLVTFYRRAGIGGYAFDYTFLDLPGTSEYAQWRGWRRVLETLRRQIPDIAIDGRQSYQNYGPWTWLAGSYPHPTSTDEQPESFVPFPDLHFDRVSADRERYTAYQYRVRDFCPPELMPGYVTHQTPRLDDSGNEVETAFRRRDWDYLGWRYSLLSSIAVGGLNNVMDMIPARDLAEFKYFSAADIAFFRKWVEWTDQNRAYLLHARFIIGQPQLDRVDGTSTILGDHGYIFLFNPNGRRLSADFKLDGSIGLKGGGRFLLEEIYARPGLRIGKPGAGFWRFGDAVSIPLEGGSATVLRIRPVENKVDEPMLFNAPGAAGLTGRVLSLTGVSGAVGTAADLFIRLPAGVHVAHVSVNGQTQRFRSEPNGITIPVQFAGEAFETMQQAGAYDPEFAGGAFHSTFRIPARIFEQLKSRHEAWPIPWTAEDLKTPWLVPERLLLFVQIAEPKEDMDAALVIDGDSIPLTKAYSSIRRNARSFVGFYADISAIVPDREHKIELRLPRLEPGQFQGVFFENVETEYTQQIVP